MRIGLYGGSFNPIHNGHIDVAAAVRNAFALDRVLFMVAKDPPHKEIADGVGARVRLAMTQLGIGDTEGFSVSDIELERPGKSYTLDTVRALRERFPQAEIFCIVGADMFFDLTEWHEAETLLRRFRAFEQECREAADAAYERHFPSPDSPLYDAEWGG